MLTKRRQPDVQSVAVEVSGVPQDGGVPTRVTLTPVEI
jgi:hypothetical protein